MQNWRGKIVTFLIIYFAGFATAIYALAPANNAKNSKRAPVKTLDSSQRTKGQEFAESVNTQIHKAISFAEEKSHIAGQAIKQKIKDYKQDK